MMSVKPSIEINRTCCTAIGGVLFLSMLVSGNNISTVNTNCSQNIDVEVIQSTSVEVCKTYTYRNGMNYALSGYNIKETLSSSVDSVIMNKEKIYNLKKLDKIIKLEDGWNGKSAKAFEKDFISKVRKIITALELQPELFPTACNSIQIEYEKEDGSYLEIELNSKDIWEVFEIDKVGEEKYYQISSDVETLIKVVDSFYG